MPGTLRSYFELIPLQRIKNCVGFEAMNAGLVRFSSNGLRRFPMEIYLPLTREDYQLFLADPLVG